MRVVLAVMVSLLVPACASGAPTPVARPAVSPGAPEFYEHERAGHVPLQMIPGQWRRAGDSLRLGPVGEVILDGAGVGTYAAVMEGRRFEPAVAGCRRSMQWDFENGDLILSGGGAGCRLEGRWRRD